MANQIQSTPSVKKISEIYRRIKEGSLILQPEFQRKFVWTSEYKEEFIDTILNGLPFPEIYIAQRGLDIETLITSEVIVDGQQRLSTIVQYIDEDEDSTEFGNKVRKFKDLGDDAKDFLNYSVVFRDLGDIQPELIREVFRRINLTKFGLEQIEIQNAIYDGEFINSAKTILDGIEDSQIPIFSESELSRMADLQFILLLQTTVVNGGYFPLDKEIEKSIVSFNDEFPNKTDIETSFITHFSKIENLNLPQDSIWYRKSNFLTLFIELYQILSDANSDALKVKLDDFENNIIQNKTESSSSNEFSKYYAAMYSGTNNRSSRVTRGELFNKYVLG